MSFNLFLAIGVVLACVKLREYVDDTEDYINIMLDDKQNQLLQMGVMLSTITLLINCAIVVVGIFGMNINIALFETQHAGKNQFVATVVGSVAAGAILYIIAIAWAKKKRLLEWGVTLQQVNKEKHILLANESL